jgi:excisionase family DNA binding protein
MATSAVSPNGLRKGKRCASPPPPAHPSPYLTAREAAAYCRFNYDHFRDLQAQYKTPAYRRGRKVLYRIDELERWVEQGRPPRAVLVRTA